MGANYYLLKPPCLTCGKADDPIHIGKSSGGWCFALHIYPPQITDLDHWEVLFNAPNIIIDSYGQTITKEEMLKKIKNRSWDKIITKSEEWFMENYAVTGPNNLVRSKIDGNHCIGHGDTWDLFVGEFC